MSRLLKVDNIMYRVTDLERSAGFYEGVLGLKRAWADPGQRMIGYVLAESDSELVIHANADLPDFDYSFLVADVAKLCNELRNNGCRIPFGPIEVRCGRYAVLADPDGNKIPIIDLTKFGGRPRYDG